MRRLSVLILVALTLVSIAAPGVRVDQKLVLAEDPLPFGKPAELVITLQWPDKSSLTPPAPEALKIPEATMIDSYLVDRGSDGSDRKVEYHLIFTHFEPGDFTVGPVQIETQAGTVESKPLAMKFAGSTPLEDDKEGEIRRPKTAVEISTVDFWRRFAIYLGSILGILLLLALILHYTGILDWFRSPKSRALKRLKKLSSDQLSPSEKLLVCVEIFRAYLSQAYGLRTRETTSKEIINLIILDNRCSHFKPLAKELLQTGDQIKFANKSVDKPEASDLLQKLTSALSEEKKVASK